LGYEKYQRDVREKAALWLFGTNSEKPA